jgi:phage shock protein C
MTTANEFRRLTKSRTDRMIDGVCGGVAAYFGIDPTLVRVSWVLLTLLGGSGILLYFAAMILMPKEQASGMPEPQTAQTPPAPSAPKDKARTNTQFWGILLVGVGLFWLAGNLGMHFWHEWWGLSLSAVIPVLMILAGVAFLFGGREYIAATPTPASDIPPADTPVGEHAAPATGSMQRLYRSRTEKKIAGVCGGIAAYLAIDPVIVRLAFVMAGIASIGFMVVVYVVLAIAVPVEPAMVEVQTPAVS